MPDQLSTPPRASAIAVGVVTALGSLGAAVLVASMVACLADHHLVDAGLALGAAIILRYLLTLLQRTWSERSAARIVSSQRHHLIEWWARRDGSTRRGGEELKAIEDLATAPRLLMLRSAAGVSALWLLVIVFCGGWWAVAIVTALSALSVPLYIRAGLRAAAATTDYDERRQRVRSRQLHLVEKALDVRGINAGSYARADIEGLSAREHAVALRAIRDTLGSSLVTEFLAGVSVGLVAMVVGFRLLDRHTTVLSAALAVLVTADFVGHFRRVGSEFHRAQALADARSVLAYAPTLDTSEGPLFSLVGVGPTPNDLNGWSCGPQQRLQIVGPSGSGKSTWASHLAGRTSHPGVRRRSGITTALVSATTPLLGTTVRDNLCLGRNVDDATLHDLLARVDLAQWCSDLDRSLGDNADALSSGEHVRLVLARALLHSPALLIVDDVVGLLDTARRSLVTTLVINYPGAVVWCGVDPLPEFPGTTWVLS